jgi:hypothetical protein
MKKTIENLQPNIRLLLDQLERESEGATRQQLEDIVRRIGMVKQVQEALEKALAVGPPRITQDHFYIEDIAGFPWDTVRELGLLDDEE